ncbi:ABC transporter substrate-binding protein [Rhizobium sp. L1K21]|uniref:ABC transporter substrate-binding protein n=1 Tax=Rhizobium sp. L1K21 TaxID=2954933 RepID=UPI002092FDD6|nr:ABC transporter substrate-binding protein [Rhizobium sp. L1K21]MCO6187041.1 ABC transporter substrate-binding protein [Rhizobium sp. L1K21]
MQKTVFGRFVFDKAFAMLLLSGFLLGGCQSDASKLAEGIEAPAPPVAGNTSEVIGNGENEIALLLPVEADGNLSADERAVRDGAALAVNDLGGKYTRLNVVSVPLEPSQAQTVFKTALASKPVALISFLPASLSVELTAKKALPPIFNLTSSSSSQGANIYGMAVDLAAEERMAIAATVAAGKKSFVLVIEDGYPADFVGTLQKQIVSAGGSVVQILRYPADIKAAASSLAKAKSAIKNADAALISGNTAATPAVIKTIKTANPGITLIGASDWPSAAYTLPEANGALVTSFQRDNLAGVAARFGSQFGYAINNYAATSYDAVALVSGLIRANGKSALSARTLTSPKGFTGTTGIFRFNKTGKIERKAISYVVNDNTLKPLEELDQAF